MTVPAATLFIISAVASACGVSTPSGPAPIRIGSLISVKGLDLPNYLAAAEGSARAIDAHGGVAGRPIVIDNCDDQQDANLAQGCARQMLRDDVIATAGNLTGFGMVDAPILDEAGIAQVGTTALSTEEFTLPTSFPIDGGLPEQIAGAILSVKPRGFHSVFVAANDAPAGRAADESIRTDAKIAGLTFAGDVFVPDAATDYASYAQQAIQSKADVLVDTMPGLAMVQLLAASNHAGAKYKVIYPGGELTPRQIQMLGGARGVLDGALEFDGMPPLSATDRFPALQTFKADMDAEYAAGDKAAAPDLRTEGTLVVWLAVQIIARLASKLHTIDAPSLLNALRTSPTVDTLGLTPPWNPTRNAPPPFTRVTNAAGYSITQRSGQEVLVDPTPVNPYQALGMGG